MIPITYKKWLEATKKSGYLKGRWDYYETAIRFIVENNCESCLEIGPGYLPLFNDSHRLDYAKHNRFLIDYHWDCSDIPWPVEDKSYDAVVALQVWEHLRHPKLAFQEVKRIVKKIIVLSLPYKWKRGPASHRGINMKRIYKWAGMRSSQHSIVFKRKEKIIVCLFHVDETSK